jgi:hypothetical protein
MMKEIEKWDGSRFDKIIAWIHEHFDVSYIAAIGMSSNNSIEFIGTLRENHYVGFFDMDDHTEARCHNQSIRMTDKPSKYSLSKEGDGYVDVIRVLLYSLMTDRNYSTICDDPIPWF